MRGVRRAHVLEDFRTHKRNRPPEPANFFNLDRASKIGQFHPIGRIIDDYIFWFYVVMNDPTRVQIRYSRENLTNHGSRDLGRTFPSD